MRERLLSAVGQHGQLLVYVIPSLELLVGEQPAVELDLGISELQSLYTQLFTRLVDVFSRCLPPFLKKLICWLLWLTSHPRVLFGVVVGAV
jgi:predicted ATPase